MKFNLNKRVKLKGCISVLLLAFNVSTSVNVNAGVPVTVVADPQALANHLKTMVEMANQLTTMKAQLQQQAQTYKSLIGSRNINDLLSNPALADYLPQEAIQSYENIRRGNYTGSLSDMARLAEKYDAKNGNSKDQYDDLTTTNKKRLETNSLIIDEVFKKSNSRLNNITRLMNRIDQTTDTKASADLQNRINTELGLLQIERNNIALMQMATDAEDKLRAQQSREISALRNRSTNKVTSMPRVF